MCLEDTASHIVGPNAAFHRSKGHKNTLIFIRTFFNKKYPDIKHANNIPEAEERPRTFIWILDKIIEVICFLAMFLSATSPIVRVEHVEFCF